MTVDDDRTRYWRELRNALIQARKAETLELRDSLLERAGEWADRLAETADRGGPEPNDTSYFIGEAMQDIGNEDWTISL